MSEPASGKMPVRCTIDPAVPGDVERIALLRSLHDPSSRVVSGASP